MKIYTKTGDEGKTSLFNGKRVLKNSIRVETYGTVDELNSILGIVLTYELPDDLKEDLNKISNLLFVLGSDLATPIDSNQKFSVQRINEENVKFLEERIDIYTNEMPQLKSFILPGGDKAAAFLHQARTVCRRAERLAISLIETKKINKDPLVYLNRLSDYLFTAARYVNYRKNIPDRNWEK